MKRTLSILLALCLAFVFVSGSFAAPGSDPVLPTATVTLVAGEDFSRTAGFTDFPITGYDTDFLVGAILTIEDTGSGYDDYFVDCLLGLSADANIKLLGKYSGKFGNFAWQGATAYTPISAGAYAVMSEMGIGMTVAEVADEVGTFYCAFSVDPYTFDTAIDVSLDLKLYANPAEGEDIVYIDAQKTLQSTEIRKTFTKVLPTVDIKLVDSADFAITDIFDDFSAAYDTDFTVGAIFTVSDAGKGYGEYIADFILSLDKTADIRLYGNYGKYGWTEGTQGWINAEAGNHMIMNSADFAIDFNYVNKSVDTFYCIFTVKGDSFNGDLGVGVNFQLFKAVESGQTPVFISPLKTSTSDTISKTFTSVAPTANITTVQGADFATTNVFKNIDATKYDLSKAIGAVFTLDNAGAGYDEWIADFEITASNGSVKGIFLGNYGDYGWVEAGTKALKQGESYVVVNDPDFTAVNVLSSDAVTFYCVFIPVEKSLVTATDISLQLFITEPVETNARRINIGEPITKSYEKYREFVIKDPVPQGAAAPVQELYVNETVSALKEELASSQVLSADDVVTVRDAEGHKVADDVKIGTGMQIVVFNTETLESTINTVIVKGDVDGDGDIIASDLEKILDQSVDNAELGDIQKHAGDLNGDGVIDAIDAAIAELYVSGNATYSEVASA